MGTTQPTPEPGEPVHRAPLSLNQEFLCAYDQGDEAGPFGPRYHIVHGWRIRGTVDAAVLRDALARIVVRHEALRTVVHRGHPEEAGQCVHPPTAPELTVRDLAPTPLAHRDRVVGELLSEEQTGTFDGSRLPHLRARLCRFAPDDAVLILTAHHATTDGWSMRLIMRDLATFYAAGRGHPVPELPPAPAYREFAAWERSVMAKAAADEARAYWRQRLDGARIVTLPTDRARSASARQTSGVHRFRIGRDTLEPVLDLARTVRATPFMALMAAFQVFVARTTGTTDVTVPTFTPGRGPAEFVNTVGSFFNFLPIRTCLSDCRTFRDVLLRVRRSCVDAYRHDIPQIPGEVPATMAPAIRDTEATCVFQVFPFPFLMDGETIGDLELSEVRQRLDSQPLASDVPDGSLWTVDLAPSGDAFASVAYRNDLFDAATITSLVSGFTEVLREVATAPDALLDAGAAPLGTPDGHAQTERA